MQNSRKSVSISDIARDCGVSAMTVSRALRPDSVIKAATRERILSAAAQMGYTRNNRMGRPAAEPVKNLSKIQLIVGGSPRKMVLFHASLITALEREATRRGCECVLFCHESDHRDFPRILDSAKRTLAHATVIAGEFSEDELQALLLNFPGALLLDHPGPVGGDFMFSSIGFDNFAATALALEHLLATGHRNIALIAGEEKHFFSREQMAGYRNVLARYAIPIRPELIRHTDFSAAGAEEAVEALLLDKAVFDAVFTNDEMAAGVYRALQKHAIPIPGRVAVVGCDDLPIAKLLNPALTSVNLDYTALAREALDCLTAPRHDGRMTMRRLAPRLAVRQST